MFLLSVVLIILLCYCLKQLCDFLRMLMKLNKFEGPKCSSLIFGNWDLICQPPEIIYKNLKSLSEKYYPHYSMRILQYGGVLILSPEDCEIFMSTSKHTRKSLLYEKFQPWLRDGLLLSSGGKWLKRRKILTPAFHFNMLKDYIKVFNEKTDDFLETLDAKRSEVVNVTPILQKFSLLAINETIGHESKNDDENGEKYRNTIASMEEVFNHCLTRPWLRYSWICAFSPIMRKQKEYVEIVHNYTKSIIKRKMEVRDEKTTNSEDITINRKKKPMAMLDILLGAYRDGKQIDYEGICEEVDTFTFEGHDTVSTAMGFCLMTIANHPEIQDKILEEVNTVLGEGSVHPTYEDLNTLELLERCIKETLRLYPSVHLISRTIDEDTTLHSGLVAPKDAWLHIPIVYIHRNPDIYPDPEKFDPDRFLPENCQHRHPFAFIPFSAGPRNCIGQRFAMLEMKVLLSAVIKKFQLVPVDTPGELELRSDTILRATNGIRVKFCPRVQSR